MLLYADEAGPCSISVNEDGVGTGEEVRYRSFGHTPYHANQNASTIRVIGDLHKTYTNCHAGYTEPVSGDVTLGKKSWGYLGYIIYVEHIPAT